MTANLRPLRRWLSATLLAAALAAGQLAVSAPGPAADRPEELGGAASAQDALFVAEGALTAALASEQAPHPDQPAWRAAYEAAEAAVAAAARSGDDALLRDALLLAARGYGLMGWHARAFASYDEYFAAGGELPAPTAPPAGVPDDAALFAQAANQLAYARYLAGDHEVATGYYLTVLDIAPDDPEALRWMARIAFERGDQAGAQVAVDLWQRLLDVTPDDGTARYYLERSRQRVEYGVAASDSFQAGVAAYEAGDLEPALQAFQTALTANPSFIDAEVWAGRVALELGLPELALSHWSRVAEARPDDGGAAYFRALAETQSTYGARAGTLYFEGLAAYEAGDLETAVERFEAATEASPGFVEAWVWAARGLQESGRAAESVPYWERVLELDPADERAAWFLRRARLATVRGDVAGPAFFDALSAYEAGEADAARALLEEAVAAEPDFAEAWGYLGRIAFQQGRYAEASEAYGRAAQLEPSVSEYAFFAEEAARLAGGDPEPEPPTPGPEPLPPGEEPPAGEGLPPDEEQPAGEPEGAGPDDDPQPDEDPPAGDPGDPPGGPALPLPPGD